MVKCKNSVRSNYDFSFKFKNVGTFNRSDFFTTEARLVFIKLRQAFIEAPIFCYFDPECHIWIRTDVSGYTIGGVSCQLASDELGKWKSLTFFSQR